jgi:beta-glucosidase
MSSHPQFPTDFVWGVATASYQIEGATTADGRGPSVWDTFCAEPGRVRDGHTGETACDHYHRWPEDLALMADLGVSAYRFSIAWPRVQPTGRGPANTAGLDFYDRLVDALAERGIAAAPTLFHWDLPQALEDAGGWLDRDTAERFAEYAGMVAERLADRVELWFTLNEPFVHTVYGYGLGIHAPGRELMLDALPTAHHQMLGHGLAVGALRGNGARRVALVNSYSPAWPASESPDDLAAAAAYDALHNRLFTDPVLLGRYPDVSAFGDLDMSYVRPGDLEAISTPVDALGVNYYNPTRVAWLADSPLPFEMRPIDGVPTTAFGWPVVPDGLRDTLVMLRDRYGDRLPPVYVTENGCSYDTADDPADDGFRIDYLDGHTRAVGAAIDAGVDVRGYFVWSLMDNFEWAEGYHQRFGLIHVDFETLARTPRRSYHWYRELITSATRP